MSETTINPQHFLIVSYPSQSHINPALNLAKRLVGMGVEEVTFVTTVYAHRRMAKANTSYAFSDSLSFIAFSDGHDEGFKPWQTDTALYMEQLKSSGSKALGDIIVKAENRGRPVTCVAYTLLLTWAGDVARVFHIPATVMWIQPAAVLGAYYHYFNGYADEITKNSSDPNWSIRLPGLPYLSARDLPSFLIPSCSEAYGFVLPCFKEQFDRLDEEESPKILVNTFDALEPETLAAFDNHKYDLITIGPLIPSAFLDGNDPTDTSSGGDLFQKSSDYLEWLNSKPESSVVYVAFGSILNLENDQMDEIARGLLATGRPFLLVIRSEGSGKEQDKLSCMEELEQNGMVVPWCSQIEVLTHPSLGCFVTHCGWNSILESLACSVPVVAFPEWTDQPTNAKLIQDVWKTGVRVTRNEKGLVEGDELKSCIEMVMDGGVLGQEMKDNARKWKDLARKATQEGGSTYKNLKSFVEGVGKCY